MNITVTKREFDYLRIQRGDIDHLANDFQEWLPAYQARIEHTFCNIKPYLSEKCKNVLDIGSGLGGIDALIYNHYHSDMNPGPSIHLLDGESDEARVLRHDRTFNDMMTALSFLNRNGVQHVSYSTPQRLARAKPFDLIVSFAAWCFHIRPSTYLDFVVSHCHADTVLILDVRRSDFRGELNEHFEVTTTIEIGKKYDRLVLKPRLKN